MTTPNPPTTAEIADFLDQMHAARYRVVRGSLRWRVGPDGRERAEVMIAEDDPQPQGDKNSQMQKESQQ